MWQAFNTDKQKKKEERVAYTCSLKPRDLLYIFCFPINFHAFPAHMPLIFVLYITMYFIHDTCR